MPAVFPSYARLGLGVIVGVVSYLVVGELNASEETLGVVASLVALLGSVGVVPPTAATLPPISPQVRFALSAIVVVLTYVLTAGVIDLDETITAIIVAVLAFAASVGIVPPQADQPVP